MEIGEYKGYTIEFSTTHGEFEITGVSGFYDTYKKTTDKIDRLVKAEVKGKFPIQVIKSSFVLGNITSYNSETNEAWFTYINTNGESRRGKERPIKFSGEPNFFSTNEHNLKLLERHRELTKENQRIRNEMQELEKQLTDPICFEDL